VEASRLNNNSLQQVEALNCIGVIYKDESIYYKQSNSQKALDFFNRWAELFHNSGDHFRESSSLEHIGDIYCSQGSYRKAIDFYNQALLLLREPEEYGFKAGIRNKIVKSYNLRGEK